MTQLTSTRTDVGRELGWGPLLVVLAGTVVTFLDFFIVNVALPAIHDELHAGPSAVLLVVAGYGLTFAAGMITGGRLGDLHGRRRMFTVGLLLFTLASAACGCAPTAGVLVAARLVQGAAGAILTPQVLAILGAVYQGPRRGVAFAGYGFAMGIAGVLGQLVGGALIDWDVAGLGWRTIFLINVPIGLLVLPLIRRMVPESRGETARLDLVGMGLVAAFIAAIVLPLVEGREHGWPRWTWLSLAAAPVLGLAFVVTQRRRPRQGRAPLLDLSLLRGRSLALGSVTALAFSSVPPAFFFVLALYLQHGRGYSALFSGVVFVAVGIGYFAALLMAVSLAERMGRQVLALGALLVTAGCVALVPAIADSSALGLLPGLAVVGFGIGLVLVPLASTVLAGVDPQHAGAASGVLATAQQVGGALGVAVIGVVFYGGGSVPDSFRTSLWVTAGVAIATAVLAQWLRPSDGAKR